MRPRYAAAILVLAVFTLCSCATRRATRQPIHYKVQGEASWYGPGFAGRRTASGERFNPNAMTAAHKTLPFGTALKVTNTGNGKDVVVRINDRGPYIEGRVIDLSKAAAHKIGMLGSGTAYVEIVAISTPGGTEIPETGRPQMKENRRRKRETKANTATEESDGEIPYF